MSETDRSIDAAPVDYFTWNRDFHGIRPRDTDDDRPVKLNAAAHAVACAIAAHINRQSGKAILGIRRIAESAQVSTSTARVAVDSIESAGWVLVTRTNRPGTKANGTSTYELTSPVEAARLRAAEKNAEVPAPLTHLAAEVYRESLHPVAGIATPCSGNRYETTSLTSVPTSEDEKISVDAGAPAAPDESMSKAEQHKWRDGYLTGALLPLHPEWTPNNANRALAASLGLDVDTVAFEFRAGMTASGRTSTEWGEVFGAFLHATAEGRADVTFPDVDEDDVAAAAVEAAVQTIATAAEDPFADYTPPAVEASAPAEIDDTEPTAVSEGEPTVIDAEVVSVDPAPPVLVAVPDRAPEDAPLILDATEERRAYARNRVLAEVNRLVSRTGRSLRPIERLRAEDLFNAGSKAVDIVTIIRNERRAERAAALAHSAA